MVLLENFRDSLMAAISAGMYRRSSTCSARSMSASAQRSSRARRAQGSRAGAGNEQAYSAGEAVVREVGEGELSLVIDAEVLVADLAAAQGHGSQVPRA